MRCRCEAHDLGDRGRTLVIYDCRCPVHCLDEDADVCWCGDFPAVGCPIHLPAPGGAA